MNRTFHVKISGTTHLFLILFTLIMLVAFWYKGAALIGMFFAMIVIINIERIIHSTYTLTADGNLVIYNGRFQKEKNIPLSQAAMEVLAIIAYNQPVSRAFIEQVRGVDSSSSVSGLLEKGLIEEAGRRISHQRGSS